MGKKVREYKSGDFIFAKVKGYPAWPARVQRMNGKKYFVYFYGTGETANLPPNMIFDYAENKSKFLTKTVKRRDFNDGVKQIEHDFANNVPLEEVIGVAVEEAPADSTANDSAIETTLNDTLDETVAEMNNTADESGKQDQPVEDSDEAGALIIDEGKAGAKGKKAKVDPKTPAKAKEAKTPRGKAKKEEIKEDLPKEAEEQELVSRSGRKIRPKRYMDEQTDDNSTLPSPAPKKRRGASPPSDKSPDKNFKQYNTVTQSELEDLKEPFKSEDADKDNILIAYLPSGQYIGIKLFQSRPNSFSSEASRLQWDKQSARNAVTLKMQLERGQITAQSVQGQLVMELNLTDAERATLDKERETEEKRSRVQFLKTEMKLIELDAKIKTCLCLEKADTELCLKLLDELMELDMKPLMLLKHPSCVETVKRLRAYVGNAPSWDLSEQAALQFSKHAHAIRKQAILLYKNIKEMFLTPEGLSFWDYFSERVLLFKKATAKLDASELLEMVHEPIEMSQPCSVTMKAAIDAAKEEETTDTDNKKKTPVKSKKPAATTTPRGKRTRKQTDERKQEEQNNKEEQITEQMDVQDNDNQNETTDETPTEDADVPMEDKSVESEINNEENQTKSDKQESDEQTNAQTNNKDDEQTESDKKSKESDNSSKESDKTTKENNKSSKDDKCVKENANNATDSEKVTESDKSSKENDKGPKESDKANKDEKNSKEVEKNAKDKSSKEKSKESEIKESTESDKNAKDDKSDNAEMGEPRAKRSRETKKTENPPPRSPAKRKSKA